MVPCSKKSMCCSAVKFPWSSRNLDKSMPQISGLAYSAGRMSILAPDVRTEDLPASASCCSKLRKAGHATSNTPLSTIVVDVLFTLLKFHANRKFLTCVYSRLRREVAQLQTLRRHSSRSIWQDTVLLRGHRSDRTITISFLSSISCRNAGCSATPPAPELPGQHG